MKTKGHWPRGKRRNPDERVELLRRTTARLLRRRLTPKKISRKALARAIGVSDRTVRRWLAGEDLPAPARTAAWAKWIEKQRLAPVTR